MQLKMPKSGYKKMQRGDSALIHGLPDFWPRAWLKMRKQRVERLFTLCFFVFGLSLVPATVSAQQSPSDVYKIVSDIQADLTEIMKADRAPVPTLRRAKGIADRKPRHVLQKARAVYDRVMVLRQLHGLKVTSLKAAPVRAIKPADVFGLVSDIRSKVRDLRPLYGLQNSAADTPRPSGKTPTDVYLALGQVDTLLNATDLPAVSPNRVYKRAMMVASDIRLLGSDRFTNSEMPSERDISGKLPKDAYEKAYTLHEKLKAFQATQPDLSVPGGIVLVDRHSGRITPALVLGVLNDMLADLGALKAAAGVLAPTDMVPDPAGKTPSDVYASIDASARFLDNWE